MPPTSILVLCSDAPENYCGALAAALSESTEAPVEVHNGESGDEPGLTVELRMIALTETRASARLAWWRPGGEPVLGPEVTLSVIDRSTLPPRAPADLARNLLKTTDLPL